MLILLLLLPTLVRADTATIFLSETEFTGGLLDRAHVNADCATALPPALSCTYTYAMFGFAGDLAAYVANDPTKAPVMGTSHVFNTTVPVYFYKDPLFYTPASTPLMAAAWSDLWSTGSLVDSSVDLNVGADNIFWTSLNNSGFPDNCAVTDLGGTGSPTVPNQGDCLGWTDNTASYPGCVNSVSTGTSWMATPFRQDQCNAQHHVLCNCVYIAPPPTPVPTPSPPPQPPANWVAYVAAMSSVVGVVLILYLYLVFRTRIPYVQLKSGATAATA